MYFTSRLETDFALQDVADVNNGLLTNFQIMKSALISDWDLQFNQRKQTTDVVYF